MEARPSSTGKKSAIKIIPCQARGSSATEAAPIRQLVLRAKEPCLGGGKLGKSTRGWHNLPPNVLHRIFDLALPSIFLPSVVHESWRKSAESYEVAVTVRRRIWLAELRFVCLGWKKAVDSHSFWPRYTLILDPSKSHLSSVLDLQSSRTTPSTPSYPTLFHRALRTTNHVCLPCRLNHPSRLGLYPSKRHNARYTPHFHRVSTCDRHNRYCAHCLRGTETLTIVDGHCLAGDSLLKYREVDYDNEGRRSLKVHNCFSCRQSALEFYVERGLIRAARGSPIRFKHEDIVFWLNGSDPAQGYILDADDTSKNTASQILEDEWLHQHTRFPILRGYADKLVDHDTNLVNLYAWSGYQDVELLDDFLRRSRTVGKVMGIPPDEMVNFTTRLERHTLNMYMDTKRLIPGKKPVENDVHDEDEDDEYDDDDDDELEAYDREVFWTRTCEDAAIQNFVRDRIRSGYWVHPSDELDSYLGHQTLPTPDELTSLSTLPPGIQHHPDRTYSHDDTTKYSTLTLHPKVTIDFYPSEGQVQQLDLAFNQALARCLRGPIARFRYERQMSGWGIKEFDQACPKPGYWCTKRLLLYMRRTAECWGPFVEEFQPQQSGHGDGRVPATTTTPNGQIRNGPGSGPGSKRISPVIEVVDDPEANLTEINPWDLQSENTDGQPSTESEPETELEDDPESEGDIDTGIDTGSVIPKVVSNQLRRDSMRPPPCSETELVIIRTEAEHPSSSLSNGKRKTPPPTTTNEPATKRRSPNSNGDSNGNGHDHEHLSTPQQHPVNGNGDRASTPSSTISTTTASESEVDSSPSDPTDPMPVTPEDLPLNRVKPQLHHDQKEKEDEIEETQQVPPPGQTEPIPPPTKTAVQDLPHIPHDFYRLGPKTDQLIYDLLQLELRPMRECRCKICKRARNLHELVEAQAEVLGRVFEQGGDEGVRLALGL